MSMKTKEKQRAKRLDLDRTYCASHVCENACGRKPPPDIWEIARKKKIPVRWAYFCGNGGTKETGEQHAY
jgi:hypothetical protein